MSFDYRMVKCSHCGASTALELGTCRKCGRELKRSNTGRVLIFAVAGAFLIITLLSILMYLTRGTAIGAVLALSILALSTLVSFVGYIWLVIAAFNVSGMWGVACLAVPIAQLGFLYKHTDRALVPFTLSVFSLILLLIASFALP